MSSERSLPDIIDISTFKDKANPRNEFPKEEVPRDLNTDETRTRQKIALACRIFYGEGLCENLGPEFAGHVSVKVGQNRILVVGHLHGSGRGLNDVTAEDIIAVDLNGKLLEGRHEPVDEIVIHTSIYKARKDVNSVVHLHPQFATAIGSTSTRILPSFLKSCYFVDVPILDIGPALLISEQSASKMVTKMGKRNVIIHKGHGVVTSGKSLEEACIIALLLEGSAKMQYISSQFGKVIPFKRAEAIEFAKKQHFETNASFWLYYENKWKKKSQAHSATFE